MKGAGPRVEPASWSGLILATSSAALPSIVALIMLVALDLAPKAFVASSERLEREFAAYAFDCSSEELSPHRGNVYGNMFWAIFQARVFVQNWRRAFLLSAAAGLGAALVSGVVGAYTMRRVRSKRASSPSGPAWRAGRLIPGATRAYTILLLCCATAIVVSWSLSDKRSVMQLVGLRQQQFAEIAFQEASPPIAASREEKVNARVIYHAGKTVELIPRWWHWAAMMSGGALAASLLCCCYVIRYARRPPPGDVMISDNGYSPMLLESVLRSLTYCSLLLALCALLFMLLWMRTVMTAVVLSVDAILAELAWDMRHDSNVLDKGASILNRGVWNASQVRLAMKVWWPAMVGVIVGGLTAGTAMSLRAIAWCRGAVRGASDPETQPFRENCGTQDRDSAAVAIGQQRSPLSEGIDASKTRRAFRRSKWATLTVAVLVLAMTVLSAAWSARLIRHSAGVARDITRAIELRQFGSDERLYFVYGVLLTHTENVRRYLLRWWLGSTATGLIGGFGSLAIGLFCIFLVGRAAEAEDLPQEPAPASDELDS